ncbi:MAG: hypothetical protein ABIL09_03975 [Gemmatimonadota bacterium]
MMRAWIKRIVREALAEAVASEVARIDAAKASEAGHLELLHKWSGLVAETSRWMKVACMLIGHGPGIGPPNTIDEFERYVVEQGIAAKYPWWQPPRKHR